MSNATLPPPPVGALTAGEIAILRAWAEDYATAYEAAERERIARAWDGLVDVGASIRAGQLVDRDKA